MHESLLSLIQCPVTASRLRVADSELISQLNSRIDRGRLCNEIGQVLKDRLDGGLVNEVGSLMYPVYGGIPWLMKDDGIRIQE